MKIAGSAQLIHEVHQLAVGNRPVCAQEDPLLLVARSRLVKRVRQRCTVDRVIVERKRQVGL